MAKLQHFIAEGYGYFLTSTTEGGKQIFNDSGNAQILCNIIYNLRKREKFFLLGFTIMPEHFHLIVTPRGNIVVSWIMQEIKKGSARLINIRGSRKGKIWMDEFYDYVIRNEDDLIKHLNYIYNNAVKRKLVEVGSRYLWCSANPKFETDLGRVLSGSGTTPTTKVLGMSVTAKKSGTTREEVI